MVLWSTWLAHFTDIRNRNQIFAKLLKKLNRTLSWSNCARTQCSFSTRKLTVKWQQRKRLPTPCRTAEWFWEIAVTLSQMQESHSTDGTPGINALQKIWSTFTESRSKARVISRNISEIHTACKSSENINTLSKAPSSKLMSTRWTEKERKIWLNSRSTTHRILRSMASKERNLWPCFRFILKSRLLKETCSWHSFCSTCRSKCNRASQDQGSNLCGKFFFLPKAEISKISNPS